MTDLLDLTGLASEETSLTISVDREADFDNTVDFYEVDADGNVVDADGNAIAPDEEGYADAAIANLLGLNLTAENGETSEFDVQLTGGAFYAPVIAVDGGFDSLLDSDAANDPTVYFTYAAANVDGFDHVMSMEDGQFSFEDLFGGGDKDFNDIVLNFEPVDETPEVEEPEVEEPEVEEPVDETPEVEEPEVEEPVVEEPVDETPEVEEPVDETPEVEEPEVEEPEVEEPEVEEPVDETPEVEEPVVEEPVVEEPVDETPEVEEPVVEEPVDETPEVEEPEVEEPVDETPEVEEPEVEEPEVEEPEVEEPVDETPEVEEPVVEEPVDETPEVEEPEVEDPMGDGSISGLKFDDLNGNGIRDSELVQGENPDVVFVVDVSGSSEFDFDGISVGDVNGDGFIDSRLDAEIAGFVALNQQLINQGLEDNADVGIVVFSGNGAQADLDSTVDGVQLTTTPNADTNGNGVSDVEDVLLSLESGAFGVGNSTGTNYEVALQTTEDTFSSIGTESGNGNLIFISDGVPVPDVVNYEDEVANLNSLGVNLSAFGAGEDSRLDRLQIIDPDAQIFTSTDQLLNVFGDLNSDADGDGEVDGGGSQSTLEPTLTGVTIYLDTNNNGSFDEGEPSQVTDDSGEYVFEDLAAGTYTVREVVPDGSTQTTAEEFTITLGDSEAVEDINFGNISDEALAMLDIEIEI